MCSRSSMRVHLSTRYISLNVKAYQAETLFALFVQHYSQSFEEHEPWPLPQLREQRVENVDMALRIELSLNRLVQCQNSVSYYRGPFRRVREST